jgi:signal peptidase I
MMDKAKQLLLDVWDFIKVVVIAVFFAMIIRGYLVEPYRIPSGSMMPTLLIGDFLFVNKMAYNTKIPFTDNYIRQAAPKRGDIVVFKQANSDLPGSFFGFGPTYLIKRVVALPGDKVAYINKKLYVNNQIPKVQQQEDYVYETAYGHTIHAQEWVQETAGFKHNILLTPSATGQNVASQVVPEGRYVVMGDNRDNSKDARYWSYPRWGYVKQEDLMGRAEIVVFSLLGFDLKLDRFFKFLAPEYIAEESVE